MFEEVRREREPINVSAAISHLLTPIYDLWHRPPAAAQYLLSQSKNGGTAVTAQLLAEIPMAQSYLTSGVRRNLHKYWSLTYGGNGPVLSWLVRQEW